MHPDIAELPLVGGHAALDLVNTLERGMPPAGEAPYDYLTDASALLRWTVRAGLVTELEADHVREAWRDAPAAAYAGLAAVLDIRERLHRALLALIPPAHPATPGDPDGTTAGDRIAAEAALVALHERWSAAATRATLVMDEGDPPTVRLTFGTVPALLVPDRVADASLAVLLTGDLTRLRSCPVPEGGCGWLFLDQSRNGSRRWCRMADCGNSVKAQRLTERRRAARAFGGESLAAPERRGSVRDDR